MNWIDMNDRDKLLNYAKAYKPSVFKILDCESDNDSYFTNCENIKREPDIFVYDIERYDKLKALLTDMWKESGLQQHDILATIVSAVALKNMPAKSEIEGSDNRNTNENVKDLDTEKHETSGTVNAPPTFIYEF